MGFSDWFCEFHLYAVPEAQGMSRAQPEKWQARIAWLSARLMPGCVSLIIISVSFALSPFRNFHLSLSLQVAVIFLNGLQRSPLYVLEIHTVIYCSLLCWFTRVSVVIEAVTEVTYGSDWWHPLGKCDI